MANSRHFLQVTDCAVGVSHKKLHDENTQDGSIGRDSETFYVSSSENVSDSSTENQDSSNSSRLSSSKIPRFIYRCVNCEYFSFSEEKLNHHAALKHAVNKDRLTNLIPLSGSSVTIRILPKDELNPEKYKIGNRYICNECSYETRKAGEFFTHINIHSWLKDVRINALTPKEAWQPIHREVHT